MLRKKSILCIFIFFIFINKSDAQFQFESYAIYHVNIIDVKQSKIINNQTIVIENDLITGIFDADKFIASDALQLLDFKGDYVVPGLIDAHVHLATDPSADDNYEVTKQRLKSLLKNGVTTVRDMAGDARYLSYLSRQASLDLIASPDIYYSALFSGETFFKDPRTKAAAQGMLPGQSPWMQAINANSDLNHIIAQAIGTGATGIKIYADLEANIIQKITQAAHDQGMKVWAHSTVFPARPSEICQAGVDVMSHATYLAWEAEKNIPVDATARHQKHKGFNSDKAEFLKLIKQMQKNHTILDATVSVFNRDESDDTLYNYGVSLTKLAYQNKVKIGVGTDMPFNNLSSAAPIFKEMAALQTDVGMKPIDIIRSATLINAEMIGKEAVIGSIEVGKKANLIILKENPTKDINNLKTQVLVIKNGQLYNSK